MRLSIRHATRFLYDAPVADSFNEARLRPVSDHTQICSAFSLTVDPPAQTREYTDFYRNEVTVIDRIESHTALEVTAESVVDTHDLPGPSGPYDTGPLEDGSLAEAHYDFLKESDFVEQGADLWRLSIDIAPRPTCPWEMARDVSAWVHRNLEYQTGVTHAATTAAKALELRQGVCQDFAHITIALCRLLKIPARYASGYLYTGKEHVESDPGATHAWVEVFIPGWGWQAIDPTHDRLVDTRYVKLAIGRDYGDAAPVRGVYRGTADRSMEVAVTVTRA